MAITDFWQLKDNQIYQGKGILNVYHLKRIQAGATAQTVAEAFVADILTTTFLNMQDSNLSRTIVEVENLGDPTDFIAFDSSSQPGTDTADNPAGFNAASIQFNRTRTDMKNGQKRFLMGNENDAAAGKWDATFLADLSIVGTSIVTPWRTAAAPGVDVCSFVILKRFCVVDGQDPCLKYRLPMNSAEIDGFHYVPIFFTTRDNVRSQVSRKRL